MVMLGLPMARFTTQIELDFPEIRGRQVSTDPAFGFGILYPKGWIANAQVSRACFWIDHGGEQKFHDPKGPRPAGVVIAIMSNKMRRGAPSVKTFRGELAASGFVVGAEVTVMIGKQQAVTFSHIIPLHSQSGTEIVSWTPQHKVWRKGSILL